MNALAGLRSLWKLGRKPQSFSRALKSQLHVEALESRLMPYSVSGNAWPHPELVTISFAPDGTSLGGGTSNLQSTFDNHPNSSFRANWRKEVLRAAQVWAQQTNLNFALVSDNAAPSGSGLYQQGDSGFGDVRIGGMNLGGSVLSTAYLPPPINNYSIAGDINFNTTQAFNINSTYDLFTAAVHEFGHGLGLYHNDFLSSAVMYPYYVGIKSSLRTDDILGIRNIYSANLGRCQDSYEGLLGNGSFLFATDVTGLLNPTDKTALVTNRDITTTSDLDYYKVTAPSGTSGTLTVKVQSTGLSLLSPLVRVYNSALVEIGSASGLNQYGATLSVPINGVTAGQQFYVMVDGADNTAFGTGKYALTLNFGNGPNPAVPLPNTQTVNGNPLSGGGGQPGQIDFEARINTTTEGAQEAPAVAMDAAGNYVAVWMSEDQDGDGWGVYGRRFDAAGVAQGDEFRVNSITDADQKDPAVAMDNAGNFVVAWTSSGDGGIHAQRFDAAGVPQGDEFRVTTTEDGDQKEPAVAMDADGDFVIVWADSAKDGNGWGIFGRRFNAAGVAQGDESRVNTLTIGDQKEPAVAMDAKGNFVVAYASAGQGDNDGGVLARTFSASGLPQRGEFRVNHFTADYQNTPAVAMDDSGRFVIAWSSKNQDGDGWGVYARRFQLANTVAGTEFRVNDGTLKDQKDPAVAMDAAGGVTVAWSSYNGGGWDVYAKQYNTAGTGMGAEFRVNTTTDGDQHQAAVAVNNYGHVAVVWSGNGAGDSDGVFTQRYAINGGTATPDNFSTEDGGHDHGSCGEGCTCPECQAAAGTAATPAPSQPEAAAAPTESSASRTSAESSSPAPSRVSKARDAVFANLDQLAEVVRIR